MNGTACNSLTLPNGFRGATVVVESEPLAQPVSCVRRGEHAVVVKLQVRGSHMIRHAATTDRCLACGKTVNAHAAADALARDFVRALVDTTMRYLDGMMKKPTYKAHARHLWAKVQDQGIAAHVLAKLKANYPATLENLTVNRIAKKEDR